MTRNPRPKQPALTRPWGTIIDGSIYRHPEPISAKPKRVRRPKGLPPFATAVPVMPRGAPSVVINEVRYEDQPSQIRAYAAWLTRAAAWIEQEAAR